MIKTLLPIIIISFACMYGCQEEKTYSIDEMKDNDALFEKISKQCEMGEIPLDSANCNNAEKAAILRAW